LTVACEDLWWLGGGEHGLELVKRMFMEVDVVSSGVTRVSKVGEDGEWWLWMVRLARQLWCGEEWLIVKAS